MTLAAGPPLLEIGGLEVSMRNEEGGEVKVVDGLSLRLDAGRTLGLVGESGCGKSVTARAVMRLLPEPPAKVRARALRFAGLDLLELDERRMRAVRGDRIAMIFQEPMTSLNPVLTVGFQVEESLRLHTPLDAAARRRRVLELLRQVGIGAPERRLAQYPFELSGGLRQRVMIAIALACGPELLIADEPTTALDVTVQAQILDLMADLRSELGTAILLITHDLGVVAEFCDEVAVMYAGRIVETASVDALFARPRHPYTVGLLAAVPRIDGTRGGRLPTIAGTVPAPGRWPEGCPFAPRCRRRLARCGAEMPPLEEPAPGHGAVACWNPAA